MNIKIYCFFILVIFLSCEKKLHSVNTGNHALKIKENYLDSLQSDILLDKQDSLFQKNLLKVAYGYEEMGFIDKSKKILEKGIQIAQSNKDTIFNANIYRYLGDLYSNQKFTDSAFLYYTKAEKLYQQSKKDSINWARVISYKGSILYKTGIYTESERELTKALIILNYLDHTRLKYETNLTMALTLKDLKEFDHAIHYYEKIPDLIDQLEKENYNPEKIEKARLLYYNNMGSLYIDLKDFNQSKRYLEKALTLKYRDKFPSLNALVLNNYAVVFLETSTNYKVIDSLLKEALKIRLEINSREGIMASKITIGKFLLAQKDTLPAIEEIKQAYKIAVEDKSYYTILKSLELLSESDTKNKNKYLTDYLIVKDSLHEIDRQTRNKFARIAYETDGIKEHNQFLKQRNLYLLLLAACAFIVAGAVYIVFRLRMRNRKLYYQRTEQDNIQKIQTLIEKQQTVADNSKEEERQRIAGDLHDSVINRLFSTRINLQNIPIENTFEKQKLMEQLEDCEQQVRQISHDIAQNIFQREQNFSNVLKELILEQQNTFNTVFNCSIDKLIDWNDFTIKQKTQMYIIIQELLQNVNKHSKASNCFVFFLKQDNKLVIKLHDNGIGMNLEKIQKGLGLKNIDRRVKKLEGTFEIKQIDQLMINIIIIPYPKKDKN